ncbi:MAG: hypothetical protein A2V66_11005 [Ignavibacteria bacterium RBG_13_36_8]|nr:MAG: hypothetical protein A2V66_11005 [Ignavibacteria bacterium RBG_13_36_8]
MTAETSKKFQRTRIIFQVFFLLLFISLFFIPGVSNLKSENLVKWYFYLDPFLLIMNFISTGGVLNLFLLSLIPLGLTLFFGRFFCGWICPFGTINQLFSRLFRKSNRTKEGVNKNILRVKYLILIALLTSALFGMQLGGWLDPFSLLTRSIAATTPAADYFAYQSISVGEKKSGEDANVFDPAYNYTKENILSDYTRTSTQAIIICGLFIFIIVMNIYSRRFFCNAICPLSALYGIVAKVGIFNFKTNSKCNSCNICSKNCTYNGNPGEDFIKSECLVCFNCLAECPSDAVDVSFGLPSMKSRPLMDVGRRKMIGAFFSGIVLTSLVKTSAWAKSTKRHSYMRPPGAVNENEFLDKCFRCGQCVQACPTSFVQPALLESGIEGMWTPIVNSKTGYCIYECNKCTQVCPSEALRKLTLKEKKVFKLGTAVIDKDKCFTYADGFNCTACYDKCPTPEKTIAFREVEIWNFQGRFTKIKQIYIKPNLCIGCAICEHACPRKDMPGIYVTADDEIREMVTGDV